MGRSPAPETVRAAAGFLPAVELRLAAVDIPPRLTFLEDLQRRPAFHGSAMLDRIVNDYRDALARARGIDMGGRHAP